MQMKMSTATFVCTEKQYAETKYMYMHCTYCTCMHACIKACMDVCIWRRMSGGPDVYVYVRTTKYVNAVHVPM